MVISTVGKCGGVVGVKWVEVGDAAEHPQRTGQPSPVRNYPAQNGGRPNWRSPGALGR